MSTTPADLIREVLQSGSMPEGWRMRAEAWLEARPAAQCELFSRPPPAAVPYVKQDTSIAAAASVRNRAQALRLTVLEALQKSPRCADRVCEALGLTHQTGSARVSELAKAGQIEDTGKTQKTRSGRDAIVWGVTPSGLELLASTRRPQLC